MIDKNAYNTQFIGTPESAYSLVYQLADQESVVLDIEKEIVDQDRSILETATGVSLVKQLEKDHQAYQLNLCNLRDRLERLEGRQPLDKKEVRRVKGEIEQTEKLLDTISDSVERLRIQPGAPMRLRMKQAMKDSGKTAAMVLGLVLNATYVVVKLSLGI
jgi:wobble nucleotide-excising tRNase